MAVADARPSPGGWSLLEQELTLRAARDPEVADRLRRRTAEGLRFSADRLADWTAAAGAAPVAPPDGLAVLVRALLTGLAAQRRLDPDSVDDDLAVRGLAALVGLDPTTGPPGPPGEGAAP
jgi:hypothetical protein